MGILNRRLYAALFEFHNEDANIIRNRLGSFVYAKQHAAITFKNYKYELINLSWKI